MSGERSVDPTDGSIYMILPWRGETMSHRRVQKDMRRRAAGQRRTDRIKAEILDSIRGARIRGAASMDDLEYGTDGRISSDEYGAVLGSMVGSGEVLVRDGVEVNGLRTDGILVIRGTCAADAVSFDIIHDYSGKEPVRLCADEWNIRNMFMFAEDDDIPTIVDNVSRFGEHVSTWTDDDDSADGGPVRVEEHTCRGMEVEMFFPEGDALPSEIRVTFDRMPDDMSWGPDNEDARYVDRMYARLLETGDVSGSPV